MKKCPVCEKEVPVNTEVCSCSFRFLPEDKNKPYCPSCNHNVKKGAEICDECGYTFPVIIHPTPDVLARVTTEAVTYAGTYYIPRKKEKYLKEKIAQYEKMLAEKDIANINHKKKSEELPANAESIKLSDTEKYYKQRYELTREKLREVQQELDVLKDRLYNSGIEL